MDRSSSLDSQLQSRPIPPFSHHTKTPFFLGLSVLAAGLIIGASGGFWLARQYYIQQQNPQLELTVRSTQQDNPQPVLSFTPTVELTKSPTITPLLSLSPVKVDDSWQTHSQPKMFFSIQLPANWGLLELTEYSAFSLGPLENGKVSEIVHGYAHVLPNERLSPDEYERSGGELQSNEKFQIENNNVTRFSVTTDTSPTGYLDEAQVQMPNGQLTIFFTYEQQYREYLTSILSTFRYQQAGN